MALYGGNKTKIKRPIDEYIELLCIAIIIFLIRTFGFGLYIVPTGSMEPTMLVGARFFADKFSYYVRAPRHGEIIAFNDPTFQYSKNPFKAFFQQHVWGPENWTKRIIGIPGDIIEGRIENNRAVIYLNGKKLEESYINPYPLIHIFTKDITSIQSEVQKELGGLSRSLGKSAMNEFMMRKINHYSTLRTYDPKFEFDKQPFYKINPDRIFQDVDGNFDLVSPDSVILRSEGRKEIKRGNDEHWNGSDEFYVVLGDDEYWCMGDNRRGSRDSRFIGPIKMKYIHGRIVFQIFSIDNDDSWSSWFLIDLVLHPIEFVKRIRYHDFFKLLT